MTGIKKRDGWSVLGKSPGLSVVKIFGPVDRLIERRLWLTIVYVKRLAADGSSGGS